MYWKDITEESYKRSEKLTFGQIINYRNKRFWEIKNGDWKKLNSFPTSSEGLIELLTKRYTLKAIKEIDCKRFAEIDFVWKKNLEAIIQYYEDVIFTIYSYENPKLLEEEVIILY